jgi:hypothetical protein
MGRYGLGATHQDFNGTIPQRGAIIQKHSAEGVKLASFLDSSIFSNPQGEFRHVTDFKMGSRALTSFGTIKDRIFAYLSVPGEWIELDLKGNVVKRSVLCGAPCITPEPSFIGVIEDRVFAWVNSGGSGFYELSDDRKAWLPVAASANFKVPNTGGIYGIQGTSLIYAHSDDYFYEFFLLDSKQLKSNQQNIAYTSKFGVDSFAERR